jgi:OOP family OmpA-OmpF porin
MRLDSSSLLFSGAIVLACSSIAPSAAAQAQAGASLQMSTEGGPASGAVVTSDDDDEDGLAPRGNLGELGLFGGLIFMSNRNALHDARLPYADFEKPTPEVGVRIAYLPLSFLGVEGEFMAGAAELVGGEGAIVWAGRGHLLLQVPTRRVNPFVLIGGGRMGISSDPAGDDTDPAHHFEALAGLSVVIGRPTPRPKDSDADGVVDLQDTCPLEAGLPPDGCPIRDRDGDGFPDPKDSCPLEAGIAPDGCPIRDADQDGVVDANDECRDVPGIPPTGCPDKDQDGILDRDDQCIDVAGVAPHGCPADSDGDGFNDPQDKCPNEPENKNGFEDNDGCPDQIPDAVKRFTGVIKGIEFETGKSEIRGISAPVLESAAAVLVQYPTLRVRVTGHTDNVGSRETNVLLSKRRAEAVKAYLMKRGVEADRIETLGEGPDSPMTSNSTRQGRQQNRRIEFQIIQ